MAIVNNAKLEAVAKFISETEVEGNCICDDLNEALGENRIDVPCDNGNCEGDCPFYSKENFLKWIKKPNKRFSIEEVKRPKLEDFQTTSNQYYEDYLAKYYDALEDYCTMLEGLFANLEYDLDNAECENKALLNKLEKIRGVLDEGY